MKKLLFILAFVVVAIAANAQRQRVITLDVDTLQGNETVSFETIKVTGSYNSIAIQGLCTQLGGTSDGTLTLYGSIDGTNWSFLNGVGGKVIASPKASNTGTDLNQITITNALVPSWEVEGSAMRYYKIVGAGTASDTTKVQLKVVLK